MKSIKIVSVMEKRFSEFYSIRIYRKQPSDQLIVKIYPIRNQKSLPVNKNE